MNQQTIDFAYLLVVSLALVFLFTYLSIGIFFKWPRLIILWPRSGAFSRRFPMKWADRHENPILFALCGWLYLLVVGSMAVGVFVILLDEIKKLY